MQRLERSENPDRPFFPHRRRRFDFCNDTISVVATLQLIEKFDILQIGNM